MVERKWRRHQGLAEEAGVPGERKTVKEEGQGQWQEAMARAMQRR